MAIVKNAKAKNQNGRLKTLLLTELQLQNMFSNKLKYNSEEICFQNTRMKKKNPKNQNTALNNIVLKQMKNSFWNNQNRRTKYVFLEYIPK